MIDYIFYIAYALLFLWGIFYEEIQKRKWRPKKGNIVNCYGNKSKITKVKKISKGSFQITLSPIHDGK